MTEVTQFTREQLNDPMWRLCNLYHIVNKEGVLVQFKPNTVQLRLLRNLARRNLILKARQQGASTLIQLMLLDQCVFIPNMYAGVVAQHAEVASTIFRDKIKLAWEHMPDWVHSSVQVVGNSERELRFTNGSWIRVDTSMRGRTLHYLHVSEFGKTSAMWPHKAKEIMTGSIQTVPDDGFVFIESTAEGRTGKFYEMVETAQKRKSTPGKRGPRDYRLHFWPWFRCPDYRQDEPEELTDEDIQYFQTVADQTGATIEPEQMYWYVALLRSEFAGNSHMMHQEYPSTPDEAFERDLDGSWFSEQLTELRKQKRITSVPHTRGVPVETAWDIGRGDGTAVWYFQRVGLDFRVINFQEWHNTDYDIIVAALLGQRGYVYGRHFLPHDATQVRQAQTASQAKSAKQILEDLGLRRIVIVPRTPIKFTSIQRARSVMLQCYFDETNCAAGITHLECYRKVWSKPHAMFTNEPVHDEHSETADAFQQLACGWTPDLRSETHARAGNQQPQINPFVQNRNS